MSTTIPTVEPSSITAGDTESWTKSFPDYLPSAGWILSYALQGGPTGTDQITFASATVSGSTFTVSQTAAQTAEWLAGVYAWTSYVTKAATSERYVMERGSISILPDPAGALEASHARRTLTLIEAAIEGRVPRGLESTTIDGQQLTRIPLAQLITLRDRYAAAVKAELNAARVAAGLPSRRTAFARFTRVS